ncbi:hypothetical protein SAMN02745866_00159 [Alteromonadaceae bacterium Bs31]|nr:hypothetical protein SAMN02745866_00159 [Alteromonadaceae bacterium Bs31]
MERKLANITELSSDNDPRFEVDSQIEKMSEIHRFSKSEMDKLKILYQGTSKGEMLKTFRDIRTRLYSGHEGKNFTCMITSVAPVGGCSHVTKNLAAAIALDKTRTALIVDANFYSPSINEIVVTDTDAGLTDYLENTKLGVGSIVYASGIPRVRAVPAGDNADGAAERLSSKRMTAFMDELKQRYSDRYILLDAPSVGEYAAEARMLASQCDFVVLVVPSGKVTVEQVQASISNLGEDKIALLVFNQV